MLVNRTHAIELLYSSYTLRMNGWSAPTNRLLDDPHAYCYLRADVPISVVDTDQTATVKSGEYLLVF